MAMELQVTHQKVTPAMQSDLPEGSVTGTCGRRGSRGLGGAELTLGAVQGGGWPRGRFGGGELAGTTPGRCPRVALHPDAAPSTHVAGPAAVAVGTAGDRALLASWT